METRVTLRDIAEKAGVHHTTVSLALRNSPRLKEETRTKIQRLAAELGYSPDPMLSSLMAYRRGTHPARYQATIAWVNNWPRRKEPYEYFGGYHRGAIDRARQLGYAVEEFWLREKGMTPARMTRILKARNIRGLLLLPQHQAQTRIEFDYSEFSIVNFGYSFQPAIFHVVTNHQAHSFRLAMAKLRALGYRRIGFYEGSDDWDERTDNAMLSGLLVEHWKQRSVKFLSPLLNRKGRYPSFLDWVHKDRPEVVLSYTSYGEALRRAGYRVPEEVGFASLHLGSMGSPVSGICQNDEMIGKSAVDLLVGMLQRGERGVPEVPVRLLVESTWNPGETLRKEPPPA